MSESGTEEEVTLPQARVKNPQKIQCYDITINLINSSIVKILNPSKVETAEIETVAQTETSEDDKNREEVIAQYQAALQERNCKILKNQKLFFSTFQKKIFK